MAMTTTEQPREIVVVGGGLAAQRCVETLRREGYTGAIHMVCAEAHLPYDRPPLSKQVLSRAVAPRSLAFRALGWYEEHQVHLLLGCAATQLRLSERRLLLADGARLRYDRLLIATGSRPRTLPRTSGYENVTVLRTLDESLALGEALADAVDLVVIGAGFIGQEVAATARGLGRQVTMVEAAQAPLATVLGEQLGSWFAGLHREEGVELLTECTIERVRANGRVQALELSNGRRVPAGHVLVAVGVDADVTWLADSGLHLDGGVAVDPCGRASVPGVFAAGDAAAPLDPSTGRRTSGSHWEAAARQGAAAARAMLGIKPGASPPSGFWSDQYGLRIQYVGQARGADAVRIDGDPAARDFTATFTRAGRSVAVLLVNRPRQLAAARREIQEA